MEYIGRLENDRKIFLNRNGIVIFGAGKELEKILNKLDEIHEKKNVICVCDNNSEKQGKEVKGLKVISPENAFTCYKDAIYIVYNQFHIEICKQLAERGIERIHLIRN